MSEEFLHYLWKHKLYKLDRFVTVDGDLFEIIHPGVYNTDAGPDFFNAKIKFDDVLWCGNVEIHVSEGDWLKHGHHKDKAYDNVIMHVVYNLNSEKRKKINDMPVWQIAFSDHLFNRYEGLYVSNKEIACEGLLTQMDEFVLNQWLDRLLIERIEQKTEQINLMLQQWQNDWDQVFYVLLARSFGYGINGLPFEMLAKRTPLRVLLKHADNLFQLEAMLFGQSGLLMDVSEEDEYVTKLKKEYLFLSNKYKLSPIDGHLWKFMRLRPSNFPTIRLAQFASFIYSNRGRFAELLLRDVIEMHTIFKVQVSEYWTSHFKLGVKSRQKFKHCLGKRSRDLLIVNAIIPYLFVFFEKRNDSANKEKVLEVLWEMPVESNHIIDAWNEIGVKCKNEGQAQALIFLKKQYCIHKKCLSCAVGHHVLSKT